VILLAIDCAASLCAAALYDAVQDRVLAREVRDIGKGHAEELTGVVETVLRVAGRTYADIGLIAVTVGPGSFTGIRVGVAFARGLSLALRIPAIGIATLEGIAAEAGSGRAVLAAIDAGRGEIHGALYSADGELLHGPFAMSPAEAAVLALENDAALAGSGADVIAEAAPRPYPLPAGRERGSSALPPSSFSSPAGSRQGDEGQPAATADIETYARLAARPGRDMTKPKPLYLRDADARPQQGFAVPRAGA
jgi:tRNA threonylcarbamoyl adenosine modification protein YeaZ